MYHATCLSGELVKAISIYSSSRNRNALDRDIAIAKLVRRIFSDDVEIVSLTDAFIGREIELMEEEELEDYLADYYDDFFFFRNSFEDIGQKYRESDKEELRIGAAYIHHLANACSHLLNIFGNIYEKLESEEDDDESDIRIMVTNF